MTEMVAMKDSMQVAGAARPDPASQILHWILRLALAGIYVAAALGKLADPLEFARSVHNYRLLPESWVLPVALILPAWEMLAALALLLGPAFRGAALSLLGFSLLFAFGVASAVVRGIDLECGCFGHVLASKASWGHVLFNCATALAAFVLLFRARRRPPRPLWAFLTPGLPRSPKSSQSS
jgi:putative oxidoreductase